MLLTTAPLHAQQQVQQTLTLPHILSSGMVLQRNAPIHLWGSATPGDPISATLNKGTAQTAADDLGQWSLYLPPQPAGGPYTLQVTASHQTETRTDVMLGDLWLASGQSNMEMPLNGFGPGTPIQNGPAEIAAASHPDLRLFLVPHTGAEYPKPDSNAAWQRCTPQSAATFSAVAYFFGRELQQHEHVAIGLIDSTWGGTPAESWVSTAGLADPALAPVWSAYADFLNTTALVPQLLEREAREDAAAKAAGKPAPAHPWHPPIEAYRPSTLYNGMIAPLTPMTIRGILWYQGETNSGPARVGIYHRLLPALIADWRTHFAQGNLPFLIAQISNFYSPGENWGALRDAQRRALAVTGTALIGTLDVGARNNVHPPDKQTVGHRFALAARSLSYHDPVHFAGPLFARADKQPNGILIRFEDPAEALACPANTCLGFEISADDHHFVPATATLSTNGGDHAVLVTNPAVYNPTYVRYAWSSFTDANLHDADGLPASTFTSEPSYSGTLLQPSATH